LGSQFRPTVIIGEWRSGDAVAGFGPLTKPVILPGCGRSNRSRILRAKSRSSYPRLKPTSAASTC